ncbi:MAG: S1C family serine protease [Rhodoferax sp.]
MNAGAPRRPGRWTRRWALALLWLCPAMLWGQTKFEGSGSGFFVSSDGLLVTAAHVVQGHDKAMVLYEGRLVPAQVLRTDPVNDLALLRVAKSPVPFLRLGRTDNIPVGLEVYAIGYPQINIQGISPKFTAGIINSGAGLRGSTKHFQFSAEIQRGNSGGPLLAADGSVVGVVLSKLAAVALKDQKMDVPQNVNYALKAGVLAELLNGQPEVPAAASINPRADKRPFEIYRDSVMAVVPVLMPSTQAANTPSPEPAP